MEVTNLGYAFECITDTNKQLGIPYSYKVLNLVTNKMSVALTVFVDDTGRLMELMYKNTTTGFVPLSSLYPTEDLITQFVKSNKPAYGVIGNFKLIVSGTIIVNPDGTIDTKKLNFYVPKTIRDNIFLCDRLSTTGGINTFVVSEPILNAYYKNFLSNITKENLSTRENFIKTTTFRG